MPNDKGREYLPPLKMRTVILNPVNNLPFVEVHTHNLEYDVDKALQTVLDLDSNDDEKLYPSQKELLQWHYK